MDPQEQYPSGQNPYDFILNPEKPPKHRGVGLPGGLPGSNNSFVMKLVILIGGAIALMIVLAIGMSFLTKNKAVNANALIGLTQTQTEIARVAAQGVPAAADQDVKNLAITVQLSVTTQQEQLIAYLARNGTKVSTKQLALKRNAQTDQKLTLAKQTSTFDGVFSQTMQTALQSYANDLKTVFSSATGENERTLLSTDYTQAQLLLSQVPSQQSLNNGN